MGNYYHGCCGWTITNNAVIEKICTNTWPAFAKMLEQTGMDLSEFASVNAYGDMEEGDAGAEEYSDLCKEFEEKTGGLTIELYYHDPDNGDGDDDVQGAFWVIEGVSTLTPEGEKLKALAGGDLEFSRWVEFG